MENKERTTYIGGSDLGNLFGLQPYGCTRRLWYEKRGVDPDHPFLGNVHTERGHLFEPVVADLYEKKTGRKTITVPPDHEFYSRKYPFIKGHPDRMLPTVRGVLEIKVPGERAFRKIQADGLPEAYILQLQHYLYLTGAEVGAFAAFWADGVKMVDFDVPKDPAMQEQIEAACVLFWESLADPQGPEKLDPTDRRCQGCQFRGTCQGDSVIDLPAGEDFQVLPQEAEEELIPLLQQFREAKEILEEAESLHEGLKGKIGKAIDKFPAVKVGEIAKIYYKPQISKRVDTAKFKKKYPDIYLDVLKDSASRPMRVYFL